MGNKLFISVPMRGRTKEAIMESMQELHKLAEKLYGLELEVIQTYIEEDPPESVSTPIWYLGKSIEKMAGANYFIGCYDFKTQAVLGGFCGCEIEEHIARTYNLPVRSVNILDFDCFKDLHGNCYKNLQS